MGKKGGKTLDDEQKGKLKAQIEFYFSPENLCKDVYLRKHMDDEGWTPLEVIAQFPKVKAYRAKYGEIRASLADSTLLEVNSSNGKMRLANEGERKKFPRVTPELEAATSPKSGQ